MDNENMVKSKCNRCGECCRVIYLQETKKAIRAIKNETSKEFILKHWHRISRKEACRRHPMIRGKDWRNVYFYTCDAWDKKTRRCKVYELRPEVCRGFPFYGRKPNNSEWLEIMGCAYATNN